jgi:hypothetical protein
MTGCFVESFRPVVGARVWFFVNHRLCTPFGQDGLSFEVPEPARDLPESADFAATFDARFQMQA